MSYIQVGNKICINIHILFYGNSFLIGYLHELCISSVQKFSQAKPGVFNQNTISCSEFVGSSDVYELARSSPRGFAFIVNIRRRREGSEKDVTLMTSLFSSMNYEVRIIQDQTKEVGFLSVQQILFRLYM